MAFCGVIIIVLPSKLGHLSTISLSKMATSANFMRAPNRLLVFVPIKVFQCADAGASLIQRMVTTYMDVRCMDVRSKRAHLDGSGALNVTFISTRSNGNERIIVRVVELALVSVMRNLRKN